MLGDYTFTLHLKPMLTIPVDGLFRNQRHDKVSSRHRYCKALCRFCVGFAFVQVFRDNRYLVHFNLLFNFAVVPSFILSQVTLMLLIAHCSCILDDQIANCVIFPYPHCGVGDLTVDWLPLCFGPVSNVNQSRVRVKAVKYLFGIVIIARI